MSYQDGRPLPVRRDTDWEDSPPKGVKKPRTVYLWMIKGKHKGAHQVEAAGYSIRDGALTLTNGEGAAVRVYASGAWHSLERGEQGDA